MVCPPPEATNEMAVATFVAFANANPQYLSEPAMDVLFRAVMAKWPCE